MIREASSMEAFAKSAIDAHRYATGAIRVPTEHASAEERQAFRQKLIEHVPTLVELDPESPESFTAVRRSMGMPEKAEGYETPAVDVGEYGPPAFEEQVAFFREVAHGQGLTQDQFQGVLKAVTEQGARTRATLAAQKAEAMDALKAEWGNAYAQKVSAAKAAAEATDAPPGLLKALEANAIDAESLKWLAQLHDQLGGVDAMKGAKDTTRGNTGEMTPAEAESRLNEIRANPEHPYWKASDPKHRWAVGEYQRLTRIALAEEADEAQGLDQHVEPQVVTAFSGRV